LRTLLLHNPAAGASHPNDRDLMRQLKTAGLSPTYQSIKDKNFKDVLNKKWDLVIVAGGDGTVARAVRALDDRDVPVAILPIGTANNIAHALGVGDDVEALIPRLKTAKPRRLDIGLARGPWGKRRFLEAVGFGAIAAAISVSGPKPPKPLRIDNGREGLQTLLKEAEPERFEIKVDGELFAGDFLFVEILNLSRTGPALPISFTASPGDGLLDVVFLFESERKRMAAWLDNPEGMPPPVTTRRGGRIDLKWKHGHARIDDRVYLPPESASPIKIELEKESLRVLVPDLNGAGPEAG
jgi:diacylglycerol kinase (ATP)